MRPFGTGLPKKSPAPKSDQLPVDNSKSPGASKAALGDPSPNPAAPLKLTKDQLAAAGLDDLKQGDEFTITITGTATKVGDDGVEADVSDAVNGEVHTDEPGGDEEAGDEDYGQPSGKIEMGPDKSMM